MRTILTLSDNFQFQPEGAAVFIQNSIFDSNKPGQELLAAHGYDIVRDFAYLQIQMEHAPEEPVWPDGIEVRPLQSSDWEKAGPEAFDSAYFNSPGLCFVAWEGERDGHISPGSLCMKSASAPGAICSSATWPPNQDKS